MDMPNEAPIGGDLNLDDETVQRRRSSAIRHMARVYRRLIASELVQEAEDLNVIFSLRCGNEYEEEVARNIQEEEDDTSESGSDNA